MTNRVASAKNYRDTLAHDIKDIRKTAEISDEIKKALSADEFSLIQKTRLEKASQESGTKLNMAKETKEYHEAKETKKQAKELVKKIVELTGKSKEEAEETVYGKSETKKESKETSGNLPSDVATQEKKAMTYFEEQPKYLKIIENIQKLRASGKIKYEDMGGGKYAVTMPCGSKNLKMYFPVDTKLADSSYNYTDFDGKEISKKETTRGKLWSKEGKKYLEQKEKEGQNLLSESEFKTLISSLLPDGDQEEQILAFMMATGFYGWMWLSDKIGDYQRAVLCFRISADRDFGYMDNDDCSLVHSSFVE